MENEHFISLLVQLHNGLPRLGPGNEQSTMKALRLCKHLPDAPDILDIGCGSGAQALVLAEATNGRITATDLIPDFLARLGEAVAQRGLTQRIQICQADMNCLPFADESFDLIWSEGAAYIMGFDAALKKWRRLVRPSGYLVVSEACWFKANPPAVLKAFWAEGYPAMRSVAANLAAARRLGWDTLSHFPLPLEAWTVDYYGPLKAQLPRFREANTADPDAQQVADMTEYEMALVERYADFYGYEFFVLRRGG